jgi:hypothetical protein
MSSDVRTYHGTFEKNYTGRVAEAEWTPFQTHFFSENLVAHEIEPGTFGSVARNYDH